MSGLEDDHYCIACGRNNPIGMRLSFDIKGDEIFTKYSFPKEFQGYKNNVHGGMISLLLDEIMVNLPLRKDKVPAVSADIRIKLKSPLAVGEPVTAKAFYLKKKSKTLIVKGELTRDSDGKLIAESEALCFKVKADLEL